MYRFIFSLLALVGLAAGGHAWHGGLNCPWISSVVCTGDKEADLQLTILLPTDAQPVVAPLPAEAQEEEQPAPPAKAPKNPNMTRTFPLKGIKVYDTSGMDLSAKEIRDAFKKATPAVVALRKLDRSFIQVLQDGTLIIIIPPEAFHAQGPKPQA